MALRPRYRSLGVVAYPYFVFVELVSPLVQVIGLPALGAGLAVGAIDWSFAGLFFVVAYGYGLVLTLAALLLDELSHTPYRSPVDRIRLVCWAVLEPFGYRQLMSLFTLRGLWSFLRGRTEWGTMTRTGFAPADASPEHPS